jgi:phosphate starvation-inducible PhoH-like protein
MTPSEKRRIRKEKQKNRNFKPVSEALNFSLSEIKPLTENQRKAFAAYKEGMHLMMHGIAGTGKTFLSFYLSLNDLLKPDTNYNKIFIIRSVVPTRDMGFLPGSNKEKTKVYEAPYYAICSELFGRADAYEYLKTKGLIEFMSTSFIRGITLNDCIVVVDECQNMDWGELSSIITRIGNNCKILFCGDYRQSDFRNREKDSKKDIVNFMKVLQNMNSFFSFIEFQSDDIVRSALVKKFIVTVDDLGMQL